MLLAVFAVAAAPLAHAQQPEHAPAGTAASPQHEAAAHEGPEAAAHGPGWWPTIWKAANFVILVGVLVYFLRAPLATYLAGRIAKVREDLVTAAQTRGCVGRTCELVAAQAVLGVANHAVCAVSAEHREARDDVVARPDVVHPEADGFHQPRRFVTEHERHREHHDVTLQGVHVTVTDAACLHPNSDLTDPGLRDRSFDDLQLARFGHFNRSVLGSHVRSPTNSVARLTNSSGYWNKAQ
jgi:hypothetical protein